MVLEDCLAWAAGGTPSDRNETRSIFIWKMMHYGARESWMIRFSISIPFQGEVSHPISLWKEYTVLLLDRENSEVFFVNLLTEDGCRAKTQKVEYCDVNAVILLKESCDDIYTTFGACFLMGIPLKSWKILSALATFKVLQEPIYTVPKAISFIVQAKVSLDKITSFLRLPDLAQDAVEKLPVDGSNLVIEIVDGNFTCMEQRLMWLSRHGYRAGRLRIMFLFGKEMERERYDRVLEDCSLKKETLKSSHLAADLILVSTDQTAADLKMSFHTGAMANAIIQLLGTIVVMSGVAWQVIFIFVLVMSICIWLQHFSETISGLSTIRSFDQELRFKDVSMKLIDDCSRPSFRNAAAMEWLYFRIDMLSIIVFTSALFFLVIILEGTIDPSLAGLAVTYGMTLNILQFLLVWSFCNIGNKMVSVERMLQYTSLPSEPEFSIVRYAPHLNFVLRGITCCFSGGKKTGIVGRSGSGKSTLIQTLFRMIEPEVGKIWIDGIDISSIGLHDLRSRLNIIPQDPIMFEGTVRSNLDPLGEYNDEQISEIKVKSGGEDKSSSTSLG
ncbi:hypothetical protein OROHE_013353 [Orobanche hederae]